MTQHVYEAEIEIPLHSEDADDLISALREYAHPRIIVRIPADSKAKAAALLSENSWRPGGFDKDEWSERLRIIRSADARRRAGDSFGGDQEHPDQHAN